MGWIKKGFKVRGCSRVLLFLFILVVSGVFGESMKLGDEIHTLEEIYKDETKETSIRRAALLDLAHLLRLSGDLEGAATAWTNAAFMESVQRDDHALLSAAECLVALGDFEKASADIKTVLLTGQDSNAIRRARYLGAQIEALTPGKHNIQPLESFIDSEEFADLRGATLFLLWRVSGKETYADRLRTEEPQSPEALLLDKSSDIALAPSAIWLLLGGREGITLTEVVSEPEVSTTEGLKHGTLQIGLFRQKANAQNMAERLKKEGFSAELSARTIHGESYWVLTVPPGDDMSTTILRLKDSGFEAFPVFE